jgi:hypothetical protein
MMARKTLDDSYGDEETVARREAALKRMLSTPHKPHKPLGKKKKSPKRAKSAKKPVFKAEF